MQVAYPVDFPMPEIQECIRIVRAKTVLDEKELFAASAWNVQGYAQRLLIGAPDTLPMAWSPKETLPPLMELRAALKTVDIAGDAPAAFPIWLTLLIQILIKIISELGE